MPATAAADTEHDTDDEVRDDVPAYESASGKTRSDDDYYPFTFDGDAYRMIKPKVAAALSLIELSERTDDGRTLTEFGADLQAMMFTLIRWVELIETGEGEPLAGRALLISRLNDFNDPLDLPDLVPVFIDLGRKMFGRPTGPSRGSSERRGGQDSNGSAASTRSGQGKTSGSSRRRSS